jgi:hypothetical protein
VVQLAQPAAVQDLDKAVAWLFAHKMPTEPTACRERYPARQQGAPPRHSRPHLHGDDWGALEARAAE